MPHALGLVKDTHDRRDQPFSLVANQLGLLDLPRSVDLRSLCSPVVDQSSLGCHDDQTEVLTQDGWTRWPDWRSSAPLATVNPLTGAMEFQCATATHTYDYDGPLWRSTNRRVSFAVTPEHRMWVRRWDERARTLRPDYSFVRAADLGWYVGLQAAPMTWMGAELDQVTIGNRTYVGDDLLALVALVVSDGWVGGALSNQNVVSFCCFRQDRLPMVRALAARLGLHELPGRAGVWKWSDAALAAWFKANAYVPQAAELRSPWKQIPTLVKAASARQVALFLNFYGDQHIQGPTRAFYTSSVKLADDLQELILRIGRRATFYRRGPRVSSGIRGRAIYSQHDDITIVESASGKLSLERKTGVYSESYRGGVYCATVPNGLLVTRHQGTVLISGNSCSAQAVVKGFRECLLIQAGKFVPLSALALYWFERYLERTVNQDAGAMIRDGMRVLRKLGAPPEADWPYDIPKFKDRPPQQAMDDAADYRIASFHRIHNLIEIKQALTINQPVVIGIEIFESFESDDVARTGMVPVPNQDVEKYLGGHAVLVVGYENSHFIVKNSWAPTGRRKVTSYCHSRFSGRTLRS